MSHSIPRGKQLSLAALEPPPKTRKKWPFYAAGALLTAWFCFHLMNQVNCPNLRGQECPRPLAEGGGDAFGETL